MDLIEQADQFQDYILDLFQMYEYVLKKHGKIKGEKAVIAHTGLLQLFESEKSLGLRILQLFTQ